MIDEADRMMDEIKQDWLEHVERAVHDNTTNANSRVIKGMCQNNVTLGSRRLERAEGGPLTAYR